MVKKKPKTLRPIMPNVGLELEYKRKLEKLIDAMHASVKFQLLRAYRNNSPEMAQDASPSVILQGVMRKLAAIWLKRFADSAEILGKHFAKSFKDQTDVSLKTALKEAGFTVKFDNTLAMNDVVQSTIDQQVLLIKSIPEKYLHDVRLLVDQSVQRGRDIGTLADTLQKKYNLTRYRATFIARNQNNVASAMMERVRCKDMGITEAIWKHSGSGRNPRQSHVAYSGKTYNINEGALIDGDRIFPGELYNCRCQARPIIPGI